MTARPREGRLFQIRWLNVHSNPPAGAPVVLAEMYVRDWRGGGSPEAINRFPFSLGGGYSLSSCCVAQPTKTLKPDTLGAVRRKRLARRLEAKVPLFADQFAAQEIASKPEYYNGVTDPDLQQALSGQIERDRARLEYLEAHAGELLVYADEPAECRDRAAKLAEEMRAVRERAIKIGAPQIAGDLGS